MRAKLVAIGNSKGVRLPKSVIDQTGLTDEIDLEVRDGLVVLRPVGAARRGWDEAFALMRQRGDDELLDGATATEFDRKGWTW